MRLEIRFAASASRLRALFIFEITVSLRPGIPRKASEAENKSCWCGTREASHLSPACRKHDLRGSRRYTGDHRHPVYALIEMHEAIRGLPVHEESRDRLHRIDTIDAGHEDVEHAA